MNTLQKQIAIALGCSALALAASPAFAQSAGASTEEMRAQLAQMQAQMQQQQQAMQKMQERLNELEAKEAATPATPAPAPVAATATATVPTDPNASQIFRPPSAPAGVAEPLPEGYVRLGDTGNLLKVDVVAQLDMMFDDKFMGYQDLFIPAAIPVEGAPYYDSGSRMNMSAKQSVFRMDFRRDTDAGTVKVVYKNNFFGFNGEEMNYNLQYMYGELETKSWSLLAGYFLSGFTDTSVFPNTLDYEGPNSFTYKYNPQLRFTPVLHVGADGKGKLTLPMTLEEPKADVAVFGDYTPYSKVPDITVGLRWETPDYHIQWSNLFRYLGVQSALNNDTRTAHSYATQLTAATGLFERDSMQAWASFGSGYANFLQDISGLGLDAAFNLQTELEPIDAEGYGLGYTHGWSDTLSSSASYGYIKLVPDQGLLINPTLPERTRYFSLNLAWQFNERTMFGVEYLWGDNTDFTGASGDAQRVQASLRYDLNP